MKIAAFLLIFLTLVFYFIPSAIATLRDAQHSRMIFLINLVFGWTVLGWIAALIWAIVESPKTAASKLVSSDITNLPRDF
jgi:Na+/H+-dicarboxylate symporter